MIYSNQYSTLEVIQVNKSFKTIVTYTSNGEQTERSHRTWGGVEKRIKAGGYKATS